MKNQNEAKILGYFEITLVVINFKGINDSFSLLTSNNDKINLNEKKWILWRESLLIKHGQIDLNHMVASPQTFLVFMDFHAEKNSNTGINAGFQTGMFCD